MGTSLLSVTLPHQTPFFQRSYFSADTWVHTSRTSLLFQSSKAFISLSSRSCSSSSVSVVESEEEEKNPSPESQPDVLPLQSESAIPDSDNLSCSGCKACGRAEIEKGCNGEGRIQGGIATFPGFGWWPIKAYRPCPGFVAAGGRYRRQGQSMDEVAFGRGGREASSGTGNADKSRKKNPSQRQFKG